MKTIKIFFSNRDYTITEINGKKLDIIKFYNENNKTMLNKVIAIKFY